MESRGTLDPDHTVHGLLNGSLNACQVRLSSRRHFVPAERKLHIQSCRNRQPHSPVDELRV